jgi:hypothetical protein
VKSENLARVCRVDIQLVKNLESNLSGPPTRAHKKS